VSHPLAHRLAAEAAGTALLVGIGTGAVVATTGVGADRFPLLALAWFFAVTIPVLLFASVSGAHLNPVVTLALWLDRRLPRREVPSHFAAQLAGAFGGSATVELLLGTGSHLGSTVPAAIPLAEIFGAEFLLTFALVVTVLALVRAGAGRGRWRLLWPGLVVAASTYLIGPLTGSSLNPTRSLAPAVLSGTYHDLWVYFLATPLASLAAVAAVRFSAWHDPVPAGTPGESRPR
jgi:glycerol uptake facilitator-like aquaporin